jgi:hypothetical protein
MKQFRNIYTYINKMPSPSYESNKKSIYKWREANLERNRAINCKYKQKRDCWKKIQKEFLSILLF